MGNNSSNSFRFATADINIKILGLFPMHLKDYNKGENSLISRDTILIIQLSTPHLSESSWEENFNRFASYSRSGWLNPIEFHLHKRPNLSKAVSLQDCFLLHDCFLFQDCFLDRWKGLFLSPYIRSLGRKMGLAYFT